MKLREVSKDIYDVDDWLDSQFGKDGSPERVAFQEKASAYYNDVSVDTSQEETNGLKLTVAADCSLPTA